MQHGFGYAEADPSLVNRWAGPPFGIGRNREATEVVFGTLQGRLFVTFDYRWTKQVASTEAMLNMRVAVVRLPAALPGLGVTPEGPVATMAPGHTPAKIAVDNDEFTRRYRVSVSNEIYGRRYAEDVFTPKIVDALLSVPRFSWRIEGVDLIGWWEPDKPVHAMGRLDVLNTVIDEIPQDIWSEFGSYSVDAWQHRET